MQTRTRPVQLHHYSRPCRGTVLFVALLLSWLTLNAAAAPLRGNATSSLQHLPRPNPVYTVADHTLLRSHFRRFLRIKAAEPFVHVFPGTNILFQILTPAPRHLGRYCGRGTGDAGAVEVDITVVDIFGKTARRALGANGTGMHIVEVTNNRQLFPGEQEVLRRIPENEVWRVYYPPSLSSSRSQGGEAASPSYVPGAVWTEVIRMKKVWANRVGREACRAALSEELGYDPYYRDALLKEQQRQHLVGPDKDAGLQVYTYPLPDDGEEEEEEEEREDDEEDVHQ